MNDISASFVRDTFASKATDVSGEELESITKLCLEFSAVDVAAIGSQERFAEIAPRLGLRHGFGVDLQVGWGLEDTDHMEEMERLMAEQLDG